MLTNKKIQSLRPQTKRYNVPDGTVPGLSLRVTPGGVKSFALLYRANGVLRRLTLGRYGEVTLTEARNRARDALADARKGADPVAERHAQRAVARGATLAEEIESYLVDAAHELRPRTIGTYATALKKFAAWSKTQRIRLVSDLTREHLVELRTHLAAMGLDKPARGAKRGKRITTNNKRSAWSVNRELQTVKTALNRWRKAGKLPQLDRDAITDCLGRLRTEHKRVDYLSPTEIGQLLAACDRHDAETFAATRAEHGGLGVAGATPRRRPIKPLVRFLLLSGCRLGEALTLTWGDVDLNAEDHDGNRVGEIHIDSKSKTHRARTVHLEVSSSLRTQLAAMKLQASGDRVFGDCTAGTTAAARKRLQREFGAPEFDYQKIRRTCATFLTNAPGIFGAASAYQSARQLGHAVAVAERHYLGALRVSRDAKTLEAAMQIDAGRGDAKRPSAAR